MPDLDADQRAELDTYARATRPTPAEVEQALARTLARIDSSKRRATLPRTPARLAWIAVASVATLALAGAAIAGVQWLRANDRPSEPDYGQAQYERVEVDASKLSRQVRESEGAELEGPSSEPDGASGETEPVLDESVKGEASSDTGEPTQKEKAQRQIRGTSGNDKSASGSPQSTTANGSPREKAEDKGDDPLDVVDAGQLADESRLLAKARKALDAGDFAGALDWVDEHARRHPKGELIEERLILEAVAACRGEQRQRGLTSLAALRRHAADSPTLSKLERTCRESD